MACLRPTGPYPVLALHGEQGSAKSTTSRALRALIDPNAAPIRSEPREVRDLMITASNSWMVVYDNLSRLPMWLSDAICRMATGGGFATRELYSDSEESIFNAQRPVVLNGIEELAIRSDLLDRSIMLYLPTIPTKHRRTEAEYWQAFDAAQPQLLGALLSAVSSAIRDQKAVTAPELPRMADFALWAMAAESAFDLPGGLTFLDAYTGNRESANTLALESVPIVRPLAELLSSRDGLWARYGGRAAPDTL